MRSATNLGKGNCLMEEALSADDPQKPDTLNDIQKLSAYYDEIGPREGDIALAFSLAGNPEHADVFEIGCGNGRDAKAIVEYTPNYRGIDRNSDMIAIAKERVPEGYFEHADAREYIFTGPYDIVFAFASLRHMNLEEVTTVISRVYQALRPEGILYISSNYGEKYEPAPPPHPGLPAMYRYNANILRKHAPHGLKLIQELTDTVRGEQWFEIAFQKVR